MNERTAPQEPAPAALAQSLVAISGFVILSFLHRNLEPAATSGDWAQYILHAKALLEGRPYTDTGYIFTQLNWSIGPRAYPPGLPLTLVPLVALGPWAGILMRFLMVVSGALFVLLAYRRLQLHMNPWLASLAAMWCGVVIELAFASVSVLSDLGFCLLCWLMILTIDRPGNWSKGRIMVAALAGLSAIAYRVAGIALIGAVVVFVLLNRGTVSRGARAVLGVSAVAFLGAIAVAPWLVPRQLLAPSIDQMLTRVVGNLRMLRLTLSEAQLYPAHSNLINDGYHLAASILFLVGMVVLIRRTWRSFMLVFAAVYALMLLVSPVSDSRYFWPLYPLVSAGLLQGVATLFAAVWRSRTASAMPAATVACLTVVTLAVFRGARVQPAPGFTDFPDAVALSDFLKAGAERGEVLRVAFANPRVLTLRTGIPAMGLINASPSTVARELARQRITHVTFGGFSAAGCQAASQLYVKAAYPSSFQHVRTFGRFTLERFTPPDSATLRNPRVADVEPEQTGLCRR
jgi:hypothetical protein